MISPKARWVRRPGVLAACGVLLILLLFLGRIAEYLLSEFVYHRHGCRCCPDEREFSRTHRVPKPIPRHIHQIFFYETDTALPAKLRRAQLSWQRHNPGYGYTLWNKTSVERLIREKYPELEELYHGYGHWVRRADMARYVILHHHGGWYVDIDIHCKKGIHDLSSAALRRNKSIIVRETGPTGCSNDFIGVTPKHPFFLHVLYGMFESNKWYIFPYATTMFSTGPMFMWGRMLNYPYRHQQVFWVENYTSYLDLMHGSSWHSFDGRFVWHFYNNMGQLRRLLKTAFSLLVLSVVCLYLWKRRKWRRVRSLFTPRSTLDKIAYRHI